MISPVYSIAIEPPANKVATATAVPFKLDAESISLFTPKLNQETLCHKNLFRSRI